jgi:hypothetical protein
MNSIEVVGNLEQKAPKQAVDGPVLRVFTKEGNTYALQHETKDFQQAIKQADKLHDKDGKDILINEKDNPNIVHAKTNRTNDVDVGRAIRPSEIEGISVKGPGEVVLASFYAKLPMDSKAFDERKEVVATAEMKEKYPNPQTVTKMARDDAIAYKGLIETGAPHPDVVAAIDLKLRESKVYSDVMKASYPDVVKSVEQLKAKESPDAAELSATGTKVVLQKTGYALPEQVVGEYTVKGGKFHDRASDALRFEDHGKKLSTPVEDPKVIAHMIEVAAAKGWGQLELKGTDTFKQIAWLEAESRGIETKGYKPNERDLEALEKLRQERGTNEKQSAGPAVSAGQPAREQNEIISTTRMLSPDEKMRVDVATKIMEKTLAKLPDAVRMGALAKMADAVQKGELKLPAPKVTQRAAEKPTVAPAQAVERTR